LKVTELPVPEELKALLIRSGIVELYPPQEEAIRKGVLEGGNMVLACPTASGKTLVAELCCLKHVLERGGKTVYLAPLRALASEKYEEFRKYAALRKPNGEKVRVGISTGDFDSSDSWLGKYDIIVTTNEKMDSLLRHRTKWAEEVSLLVADEVHLLNEAERGPTLEVVVARFMQLNPSVQILALSATINNVDEVAGWLNAQHVVSEWRPITLREGVLLRDEIQFKDGGSKRVVQASKTDYLNVVLDTVKAGGQVLVFASTRKNTVTLAKRIAEKTRDSLSASVKRILDREAERILSAGERTRVSDALADVVKRGVAFHHAGLSSAHRQIIEDLFRQRRLKVLTATPTLAFGVNLPARTVIVQDYRRYEPGYGYYPISVLEYKQMAGRAGRPKYDEVGEAVLIAKTADEAEYLMESYVLAHPERIWSRLAVEKVIRSHVLATVASGFAFMESGIQEFFGKTFYAYQHDVGNIQKTIAKTLKYLYDEEMLGVEGNRVYATTLGRRISELYIDPASAVLIRDALKDLVGCPTEFGIFSLIAHTPDMGPVARPYSREIDALAAYAETHREELLFEPPSEWTDRVGYEQFLGEVKTSMVLSSWVEEETEENIIERFDVLPGDIYRIIENAKWLLYATHELAKLLKKPLAQSFSLELAQRVTKGVKRDLLPLTRLEGVGRVRGRVLYNAGYKTLEDLKHASLDELAKLPLIGLRVAKKIKAQAGGHVKWEEWKTAGEREEWEQKPLSEY